MPPHATPSRLPAPLFQLARRVRRRVHLAVHGEAADTYFDIHNLRKLNRLLAEKGHPSLTADPAVAETDAAGATRFVLALLASSPSLRRRFPRALSEGENGGFARWLAQEGTSSLKLTTTARANVLAAFAENHFARGEKLLDIRFDLCREMPLALTPMQRGQLLHWFLAFGHECPASLLDLLWYLFAVDERPGRGLGEMYRLKPNWQKAVPHGLTVFGWEELKQWLAIHLKARGRWFRRATLEPHYGPWDELLLLLRARPALRETFPLAAAQGGDAGAVEKWIEQTPNLPRPGAEWQACLADDIRNGLPKQPGLNFVSLFRYTSGLQQASLGMVDALTAAGVRTELRDMPVPHKREVRDRNGLAGLEPFDISLVSTGLDTPPLQAYQLASLHPQPNTYRIALWWWELDTLPATYHDRGTAIDEIWAPTRFIAKAMSALGKPVVPMLPSVRLPAFTPRSKQEVGLNEKAFTFLFVFDMNSRMPRKNPRGLIEAFRKAFDPSEPVELVLKVSPQERFYPEWWAELRAAVAESGVTLLERNLDRGTLLALMNAADAYVSLHRAEGFGLTMAETMLMGKPTIATGYSGNRDFMTPENSFLVNSSLTTLEEDIDPYPRGAAWAEPDLAHAAKQMRRVYDHPDDARRVAARGQAELQALLSPAAAGERMAARLREISSRRPKWSVAGS